MFQALPVPEGDAKRRSLLVELKDLVAKRDRILGTMRNDMQRDEGAELMGMSVDERYLRADPNVPSTLHYTGSKHEEDGDVDVGESVGSRDMAEAFPVDAVASDGVGAQSIEEHGYGSESVVSTLSAKQSLEGAEEQVDGATDSEQNAQSATAPDGQEDTQSSTEAASQAGVGNDVRGGEDGAEEHKDTGSLDGGDHAAGSVISAAGTQVSRATQGSRRSGQAGSKSGSKSGATASGTSVASLSKRRLSQLSTGERRKLLGLKMNAAERQALMDEGELATKNYLEFEVQVEALFPISVFGELAILDPWEGHSEGTVMAETFCEVLVINKNQIDHRALLRPLLTEIKSKATHYPDDTTVLRKAQ